MIGPLEHKQLLKVGLDLRPRPEQVPGIPQIQTMRQFIPTWFPRERSRNDIVDFSFVLNHSVE